MNNSSNIVDMKFQEGKRKKEKTAKRRPEWELGEVGETFWEVGKGCSGAVSQFTTNLSDLPTPRFRNGGAVASRDRTQLPPTEYYAAATGT